LGLAACQATASEASIAVIVSSGKGTAADPYTVSTLPGPDCRAQAFTVIDEVAKVIIPTPASFTYTTAPSPTPGLIPSESTSPTS